MGNSFKHTCIHCTQLGIKRWLENSNSDRNYHKRAEKFSQFIAFFISTATASNTLDKKIYAEALRKPLEQSVGVRDSEVVLALGSSHFKLWCPGWDHGPWVTALCGHPLPCLLQHVLMLRGCAVGAKGQEKWLHVEPSVAETLVSGSSCVDVGRRGVGKRLCCS